MRDCAFVVFATVLRKMRTGANGTKLRRKVNLAAGVAGFELQRVLPAHAFQMCSCQIQQGVIAKTVRVAFAELGDLDDAQGEQFACRVRMTVGGKGSAAVLDRLSSLVERFHQNPHLVVVEGAGERVFCQELEHGPPGTRYLRASVAG